MKARKLISHQWLNQMGGMMMVAVGIIALAQPAPTISLHCLENAAIQRLTPIVSKTELGRQVLSVYVEQNAQCRETI